MIKMILAAPKGVNLKKFLDVAGRGAESYGKYSLSKHLDGNSVDANLIDFNTLDAIAELQELCPVEIHFEADGGNSPYDGDPYDEELFSDALNELYRYNAVRNDLDIFTDIVNEHNARAYA